MWRCRIVANIAAMQGKLTGVEYEAKLKECGAPILTELPQNNLRRTFSDASLTSIRVYPNPNKGQFEVVFEGKEDLLTIGLYDFSGKLVANLAEPDIAENSLSFDGKDLPVGIYFLKATTIEGTYTEKILISR